MRERRKNPPPGPPPGGIPLAAPDLVPGHVEREADARVHWVGHSTLLLQLPGANLLFDPVWSDRVSPVPFAGPRRFTPPGIPFAALPPIDAVLVSHDHYDHLDDATVRRLEARERARGAGGEGEGPTWFTPLGYREWFARRGIARVVEMDWWDGADLPLRTGSPRGRAERGRPSGRPEEEAPSGGRPGRGSGVRIHAVPAQHWAQRSMRRSQVNRRLWCGWVVSTAGGTIYMAGDTGWGPFFQEIGDRFGPLRAAFLPIGAYEPRWFMRGAHMGPEEAVRAYRDLGGAGAFLGIHWGAFQLTDEDPREPPILTEWAWREAGLPPGRLHLPHPGGTVLLPPAAVHPDGT